MKALLLIWLVGCAGDDEPLDLRDPAPELPLPDLDGVDLDAAFADALTVALRADARTAWDGHALGLGAASPGCPDLYAGSFDLDDRDVPDRGLSWSDHCRTPAGDTFGGYAWWEDRLLASGDAAAPAGRTVDASRALRAAGVMADVDGAPWWELNGEATDSLLLTEGPDYAEWTYNSVLRGTLTGLLPFDPDTSGIPGGWRADMYLRATGGDTQTLELRGNLYLFAHRIAGRFDSVDVNLAWGEPGAQGPDACDLEPRGWIGVRDEDAAWLDVVFQPRFDDDPTGEAYADVERGPCDGCGSLYVRGIEQQGVTVCPDLSFVWDGALTHPAPHEFVLDLRTLLREIP